MTSHEVYKAWQLARHNHLLQASVAILFLMLLAAATAPFLPLPDPTKQELAEILLPPCWLQNGSMEHPLGTDFLGRDILSRMVWGSRVSLIVGVAAVALAVAIGVPLGIVAAYHGGWIDEVIMRTFDIVLSVPNLLIAISVLMVLGQSLPILILVLGFRTTVWYARTLRSKVLSVREEQFVKAARALGFGPTAIMIRHVLPNSLAPILVLTTIYLGMMIIVESSLSFLGLTKLHISWGFMVAESRDHIATSWWTATFPGLCIFLTVLSVNIVGDFLRDVFDPRLQPRME